MQRREFITLLGASTFAWPLAARAQQATGVRRVAFLHPYPENDAEVLARVIAFREGLESLGWTENRNIRIEHRYSGGDLGRIRAYATELVHSAPGLIVGSGTPIAAALKEATSTIPIVFNLVNDPVGQGFVASLSRPGGNITGFTFIDFPLIGKWLEMIKEIAPGVRHIALMFNPDTTPFYPAFLHELEAANKSLAVELSASPVHNEAEVEAAITALAREPGGGLIAAPDAFINNHRRAIMTLTEQHRLPAIYGFRQFAREGALISYGPDSGDIVRRSAGYVDRILKGERPADLPVQAPTKYELVINLKTAKALGIDVPLHLQQIADEVIE
ncbi:ABC transporter substrate-binding protein [Bradyrhizobium sp.]|uniref:ABC transporter substrate-binding protein n=1 Tax=Bradyrhizobium sp. TaxID=376 RepID=UPI003C772A51